MPEAPQPILQAHEVQRLAMETAAKGAEKAAAAALTAPQREVAEIASKNLGANRAREAALTVSTGLKHTADADALEQRAFLSNVGPDGKRVAAPGSTEQTRLDTVKNLREAYARLVLDPGHLQPGDITLLSPQIEAMIQANAAAFPGLLEAFQSGTGFDATLIQNLMKNPQVANMLAVEINRIYDGAAANLPKVAQIEERTLQAQQDLVKVAGDRTALEARKTAIGNAAADERNFLTAPHRYIDHTGTEVPAASKAQAMQDIDNTLLNSGSPDDGIKFFAKNVGELRAFQAQLEQTGLSATQRADIQKRIAERRQWIVKAENDPTYGRLCKEYSRLSAEQQDIEKRVAESTDGKTVAELDKQIQDKKNEEAQKQKAVEDLQLEKNTMVGDMESAMQNALAEACAQYITQEKNAVFENYPAYEQQAKTKMEEDARRVLHQALQNRYFKMELVPANMLDAIKLKMHKFSPREVFRPVFDSRAAVDDIKKFTEAGFKPEDWLRGIMTGAGMNADQADLMLRDPQFVKDHMSIATQRALRAYEWKNGMGPETISGLVETEWGAAAVDYIIKQHGAAADLGKDYAAEGGHISRSVKERMGAGWLLKLMLFLMSIGASPFVMGKGTS